MPLDKLVNKESLQSHRDKVNNAFEAIDSNTDKISDPDSLGVSSSLGGESRQLTSWAADVDSIVGVDYGFGNNTELAKSLQRNAVLESISEFDNSKTEKSENNKEQARIFFKFGDTTSVDAGGRLIDPDKYDISFTIDKQPTYNFPTVLSQNISNTDNEKEMQVFLDIPANKFNIVVRGQKHTLDNSGDFVGRYRVKYTDSQNEITIYKDGIVIASTSAAFKGSADEPLATFTIGCRHNNSVDSYGGFFDGGVISDVSFPANKNIVVIGASIMNGAFDNEKAAVRYLHDIGSSFLDISEFAVSGDKSADTLAALPGVIAGIDTPSLFVIHTGGNDVSSSRPFATAEASKIEELHSNLVSIIGLIKAAGHDVALANLTYRAYGNMASPLDGSLPYNKAIHEPLIRKLTPEWWDYKNNKPVIDLYSWAEDNQDLMQADGVHYTAEGYTALREFIIDVVNSKYNINRTYINLDNFNNGQSEYHGVQNGALTISNLDYDSIIYGYNAEPLIQLIDQVGIGAQLLLKNISGSDILASDLVDASSLKQVFFNDSGSLVESTVSLPAESKWRMLSGGTTPNNSTKHFIRVV